MPDAVTADKEKEPFPFGKNSYLNMAE